MICIFILDLAKITGCIRQQAFLLQVSFTLDSVLDQQPGEELHAWGSKVTPDEVKGGQFLISSNRSFVDHPSSQLPILSGEDADPIVQGIVKAHTQ